MNREEKEKLQYAQLAVDCAQLTAGVFLTVEQHGKFMRAVLDGIALGETFGELKALGRDLEGKKSA